MINQVWLEIGKRIKELRKLKKLSQQAFAERIGRDFTTVSKIEAGKLELSNTIRLSICNVFGIRKEWLLNGKGEMFDDRWRILEERATELGEDISIQLAMLKGIKQAYDELAAQAEKRGFFTKEERAYIEKLVEVFRFKDEGTKQALKHVIDTSLKVPGVKRKRVKIAVGEDFNGPVLCIRCRKPMGNRAEDCKCNGRE